MHRSSSDLYSSFHTDTPPINVERPTMTSEQILAEIRETNLAYLMLAQASEQLSYQIPAFRTQRMLVGFGATERHCALYVMSSTALKGMEQELIYYMEKIDIHEEQIRLRQHCEYFASILQEADESKGKKLSFILQEIGREINTTPDRRPSPVSACTSANTRSCATAKGPNWSSKAMRRRARSRPR